MNPVTGVGAPAYTSGVQEWKGTALNLKSRPTPSKAMPASSRPWPCVPLRIASSIADKVKEPE